jgi:hypothetical protein
LQLAVRDAQKGFAIIRRATIRRSNRGRIRGPGAAAELLGMKPTTLAARLRALGITGSTPPDGVGNPGQMWVMRRTRA